MSRLQYVYNATQLLFICHFNLSYMSGCVMAGLSGLLDDHKKNRLLTHDIHEVDETA